LPDIDIPAVETSRASKAAPTQPAPPAPVPTGKSPSMILEALKEELFQLEVEHKQGSISQAEYEKAKAALDQTLERAIKRTQKG
jgi:hypothetical protein